MLSLLSPYALPIVSLCSLYAHVDSPMLSLPSAYGFTMVSLWPSYATRPPP